MIVFKYEIDVDHDLKAPEGKILKVDVVKDKLTFWIAIASADAPVVDRKIHIIPTGREFDFGEVKFDFIDTVFIHSVPGARPFVFHIFEEYAPVLLPISSNPEGATNG